MEMILDFCKQDKDSDSIFYRYHIGKYLVTFSQYQDNGKKTKSTNTRGCIYQVTVWGPQGGNLPELLIREENGYPSKYACEVCANRYSTIDEVDIIIRRLRYAKNVLREIKKFFETSHHYDLWKTREHLED